MTPSVDDIDLDKRNNSSKIKEIKRKLEKIPLINFESKNGSEVPEHDIKDISYARPEAIANIFYRDQQNMQRHLDKFIEDENFKEKWTETLKHIKDSDHDENKIEKFKDSFDEVFG